MNGLLLSVGKNRPSIWNHHEGGADVIGDGSPGAVSLPCRLLETQGQPGHCQYFLSGTDGRGRELTETGSRALVPHLALSPPPHALF